MATKKPAKKVTKKRYPVQNTSLVRLANPSVNGIIRSDRILSKLNKRLYRQGRYYQIKIDLDLSQADTPGPIVVYALRDTWGNQKAFQMAYEMYLDATKEERSRLSKDQLARWQDFRVQDGTGYSELLPMTFDQSQVSTNLTIGEFNVTQVEDNAGNTMQFTWGDAVAGSLYSIVGEYDLSGNTDDSPVSNSENIPYDTLQENISDVENEQLRNRGNDPPYNGDSFGDRWVRVATLSRTPGQQRLTTGFFTAPCGLAVVTGLDVAVPTQLEFTAKLGDYKGVHADSMLEV